MNEINDSCYMSACQIELILRMTRVHDDVDDDDDDAQDAGDVVVGCGLLEREVFQLSSSSPVSGEEWALRPLRLSVAIWLMGDNPAFEGDHSTIRRPNT
jgi:hypothetical protein